MDSVAVIQILAGLICIGLIAFLVYRTVRSRHSPNVPSRSAYIWLWIGTVFFGVGLLGQIGRPISDIAGFLISLLPGLTLFGLCLVNLVRAHRLRRRMTEEPPASRP